MNRLPWRPRSLDQMTSDPPGPTGALSTPRTQPSCWGWRHKEGRDSRLLLTQSLPCFLPLAVQMAELLSSRWPGEYLPHPPLPAFPGSPVRPLLEGLSSRLLRVRPGRICGLRGLSVGFQVGAELPRPPAPRSWDVGPCRGRPRAVSGQADVITVDLTFTFLVSLEVSMGPPRTSFTLRCVTVKTIRLCDCCSHQP